jgi:mRNA interferase MazF
MSLFSYFAKRSNQFFNTVLNAPITSKIRNFPMRLEVIFEHKRGQICLEQQRCIDKIRLKIKMASLPINDIENLKKITKRIFN